LCDDARGLVRQNPDVDALIRSTLLAQPGVAEVYRISDFKSGCGAGPDADPKQAMRRLVCESVVADDSGEYGDYYIVPAPGSFFVEPPDVVSHGTPYVYDREVPLLIRYPRGKGGETVPSAKFTSFHDSLRYALTGRRPATSSARACGSDGPRSCRFQPETLTTLGFNHHGRSMRTILTCGVVAVSFPCHPAGYCPRPPRAPLVGLFFLSRLWVGNEPSRSSTASNLYHAIARLERPHSNGSTYAR
jgi:hypothetical protein